MLFRSQTRDLPRNRVVRDETVLDIAGHAPRTREDLARMRGLSRGFAEGRMSEDVLAAVARGLAVPERDLPQGEPRFDLPPGTGPIVELLKVLLKLKSEECDVAQRLIATTSDLERIAADDRADVPAMQGWRREVFGEAALDLKHGRLAIALRGKRVALMPTQAGASVPSPA